MQIKSERNSSIETIKIFAMILIVISHVTQTLYSQNIHFDADYVLEISHATTNVQNLILTWMASFGSQGNAIFFICSAWFLIDIDRIDFRKVLRLLLDVWIINIITLLIFKIGAWHQLPVRDVIGCIFPTTFELNWYITCFILFYLIHVGLNYIIKKCNQKQLLTINIITLALYCGVNYIHGGHYFVNPLIGFIVIYFAIAYMKLYMKEYNTNRKKNIIALIIGIIGLPVLILITNFLGLRYSAFENELARWGVNLSPFLILAAVSLLNLSRQKSFVSKPINSISGILMLVYIIHENYLLREYVRPKIWIFIYQNIGYKYVVLLDLAFAICLFILATLIAYIYKFTLQKLVYKISDKVCLLAGTWHERFCSLLMRIK